MSNDFFLIKLKGHNESLSQELQTIQMTGDKISERVGHSTVMISDKLYIFGGTGENQEILSDMYVVDTTEMTIKKIFIRSPSPSITLGFGLHLFEDNLLIYGGFDGENDSNEMYIFDLKHERWSVVQQAKQLDKIHIGGSSAMVHGKLMLFGRFSSVRVTNFYFFLTI